MFSHYLPYKRSLAKFRQNFTLNTKAYCSMFYEIVK